MKDHSMLETIQLQQNFKHTEVSYFEFKKLGRTIVWTLVHFKAITLQFLILSESHLAKSIFPKSIQSRFEEIKRWRCQQPLYTLTLYAQEIKSWEALL